MGRVLFITANRIGDAVLQSGVLAHLVETRTKHRFTIAAGPLAAPLFRAVPRLDRLIVHKKQKYGGHWLALWRQTLAGRWDMVVDLRGSRTSWFLNAQRRAIAGKPGFSQHKVAEAASVLALDPPPAPRLWLDATAQAEAEAAIPAAGAPILAFAPTASAPFKVWPADRFAQLAERLTAPTGPLPGARVALLGGPGEAQITAKAAAGVPGARVINLAGALDLPAVAAVLARCALFVGNDSGLMHIAAAVGASTLGLFGPTDERIYGPWGLRAASVRGGSAADAAAREALRHADHSMMNELTVDRVAAAAGDLLAPAVAPMETAP